MEDPYAVDGIHFGVTIVQDVESAFRQDHAGSVETPRRFEAVDSKWTNASGRGRRQDAQQRKASRAADPRQRAESPESARCQPGRRTADVRGSERSLAGATLNSRTRDEIRPIELDPVVDSSVGDSPSVSLSAFPCIVEKSGESMARDIPGILATIARRQSAVANDRHHGANRQTLAPVFPDIFTSDLNWQRTYDNTPFRGALYLYARTLRNSKVKSGFRGCDLQEKSPKGPSNRQHSPFPRKTFRHFPSFAKSW